jgi:hypothetical protein
MSNTATMARTDSDVHIQFCSSASTWGEIEDYATCIKGTITSSEEGSDDDTLVGKLRLFYLDLGAILETNIRGFDLFDVRSETAPFYSALIDPESIQGMAWPTGQQAEEEETTERHEGLYWDDRPDSEKKFTRLFLPNYFNTFRETLRLDRAYSDLIGNRGTVLEQMGRYDEARKHFDEASFFRL